MNQTRHDVTVVVDHPSAIPWDQLVELPLGLGTTPILLVMIRAVAIAVTVSMGVAEEIGVDVADTAGEVEIDILETMIENRTV